MKRIIREILKEEEYLKNVRYISDNVKEVETTITDEVILKYKSLFPNKWILYNKELNYLWVKDKPSEYEGELPHKIYHVSYNPNLDVEGIKPSTSIDNPLGYYGMSFFYLSKEDSLYGSIPYIEGENYLYEIDTNIGVRWYEGFNEPLDGEENITTNELIDPQYISKL